MTHSPLALACYRDTDNPEKRFAFAQVKQSEAGTGRITLRLFRDESSRDGIGPCQFQIVLTCLEALELATGLQTVREFEIRRMTGRDGDPQMLLTSTCG